MNDTTVNAGDIARLVDVGRAAVSNWRRRHDDFPQPVGGTASSPLFSLCEVEEWLRRNGKTYQVSLADRVWQRLRAAGDDLRLGELVAAAGALLTGKPSALDDDLTVLITELADERGPADAFQFLCDRYLEAHSRRLFVTAPDVVTFVADLVGAGDTVLDPACGLGSSLLAVAAKRVLGQELTASGATIANARLLLAEPGRATTVAGGDSLRHDAFGGELADVVVCDPPFNERAWGYAELTSDPRWVYGLPPRGESELAWIQHCLAHTRPGGVAAVLMPPAAASRRPGKRIRGNLLRAGALRAVLALGATDLWLLRAPKPGERPPSHLLLTQADDDRADVVRAWRRHLADPDQSTSGSVRIIDLLDDDVDVSPARRRPADDGRHIVDGFQAASRQLRAAVPRPPELVPLARRRDLPTTTVGELARAGLLTITHGPARLPAEGDEPVLTADDLAENRPPSGRTADDAGLVRVAAGDVVASVLGVARVLSDGGAVLGPYLARYRVDPGRLDPDFLAGLLRCGDTHPGSSRVDARRLRVPLLPLAEQRAYGAAFRELTEVADVLRVAAAAGAELVRLGFDGLIAGHLRPEHQPGERC
ncbi:MAG TPA: N-6 DNA methylase [Pseudonocardiaceae bacterium]|nr:N-6 DNA methylase [Pseudonocardiaceae bacterium]